MSRSVFFKTLWVLSERHGSARLINFHSKTMLLGPNGTGKSRISKSLYRALGCDPRKWKSGSWDVDAIVALDFTYNGASYFVIRNRGQMALFDGERLIFCATKMGDWNRKIGLFFGYHLQLPRHNGQSGQASIEHLTLPFYMDQDGGWGASWDSYLNLSQFKGWKGPTFEAFIGQRLNAYFSMKQRRDEVAAEINEKRKEYAAHTEAFRRVQGFLPRDVPTLDPQSFRNELAHLGRLATDTYRAQAATKQQLLNTIRDRERLRADLRLTAAAQNDLTEDTMYLAELPEGTLECPMCGTKHETSFHAKLQLSQDSESMASLVADLKDQVGELEAEEAGLLLALQDAQSSLARINEASKQREAALEIGDLLAAHSKQALGSAFQQVSEELVGVLSQYEEQELILRSDMKALDDKHRAKLVKEFYSRAVAEFSYALNVPADEQVSRVKVGERAQAGGSSAPRSMLAVHLALLKTNADYGDSPLFPFVVDTPQQSGQDGTNLRTMIEVLSSVAGSQHQVILAVEALPEGLVIGDFEVVAFEETHGALSKADFPIVFKRIAEPYKKMCAEVESQRIASSRARLEKGRDSAGTDTF